MGMNGWSLKDLSIPFPWYLGVSKNRGTPKWMVYNGKPYRNGWFGGTKISETPTWTVWWKTTSCDHVFFWMYIDTPLQRVSNISYAGSCKFWPGMFCFFTTSIFSNIQWTTTIPNKKHQFCWVRTMKPVDLRKAISKTATTLKTIVVTNTHYKLHSHWPHCSTFEIIQYYPLFA